MSIRGQVRPSRPSVRPSIYWTVVFARSGNETKRNKMESVVLGLLCVYWSLAMQYILYRWPLPYRRVNPGALRLRLRAKCKCK